jgi:hypothetical protein
VAAVIVGRKVHRTDDGIRRRLERYSRTHDDALPYDRQSYPVAVCVRVWFDDDVMVDAIKGWNADHALIRAFWNWPDAEQIELLGLSTLDSSADALNRR